MTTHKTLPIDRKELVRLMKQCFKFEEGYPTVVRYYLGAKPHMGAIPGEKGFKRADCSGFFRWLINGATHGKVTPPDGSWHQQEWCKSQGFKKTDYKLHAGLNDNRLRVAFINGGGGKIGHIWAIINGLTIECYSGHGCGRRPWNTPVLLKNVSSCYVLTDVLND